jgi:hypothetical protein
MGDINLISKIPYAYTYLRKDQMDDIGKLRPYDKTKINIWLNKHSNSCFFPKKPQVPDANDYLTDYHSILVFCTRYDMCINDGIINLTGDDLDKFLNNTLGYAQITFPWFNNEPDGAKSHQPYINYKKYILGIYSVCKTSKKVKSGKILFSNIILGIKQLVSIMKRDNIIPNVITDDKQIELWLEIDLDNTEFEKVANTYVSFGFKNPYITNKNFNGVIRPPTEGRNKILALSRQLYNNEINIERETNNVFQQVKFMFADYNRHKVIENYLTILVCNFDKNTLYELIMLPIIAIDGVNLLGLGGADGNDKLQTNHREYSGSFDISMYQYLNDTAGVPGLKITLTTSTNNSLYKHNISNGPSVRHIGEPLSTKVAVESFTYHTHPIHYYLVNKLAIAPPSSLDVGVFLVSQFPELSGWAEDTMDTRIPTMVHFVITLEGIYSLSFRSEFILHIKKNGIKPNYFNDFVTNGNAWPGLASKYEYNPNKRIHDWYGGGLKKEERTKNIKKYFEWLDTDVYSQDMPVKIHLVEWSDLFTKNIDFQFNIPTTGEQSFVPYSYLNNIRTYLSFDDIFKDPNKLSISAAGKDRFKVVTVDQEQLMTCHQKKIYNEQKKRSRKVSRKGSRKGSRKVSRKKSIV